MPKPESDPLCELDSNRYQIKCSSIKPHSRCAECPMRRQTLDQQIAEQQECHRQSLIARMSDGENDMVDRLLACRDLNSQFPVSLDPRVTMNTCMLLDSQISLHNEIRELTKLLKAGINVRTVG